MEREMAAFAFQRIATIYFKLIPSNSIGKTSPDINNSIVFIHQSIEMSSFQHINVKINLKQSGGSGAIEKLRLAFK